MEVCALGVPSSFGMKSIILRHEYSCGMASYKSSDWLIDEGSARSLTPVNVDIFGMYD